MWLSRGFLGCIEKTVTEHEDSKDQEPDTSRVTGMLCFILGSNEVKVRRGREVP